MRINRIIDFKANGERQIETVGNKKEKRSKNKEERNK